MIGTCYIVFETYLIISSHETQSEQECFIYVCILNSWTESGNESPDGDSSIMYITGKCKSTTTVWSSTSLYKYSVIHS